MDSMMMPFRKGDWQQRFNAISRCSPPISVQQWRQKWFSHCECSNIFNVQVLNIVCPILHCVPIAQLALPHLTDGRHGWRKNNISMSVNGQGQLIPQSITISKCSQYCPSILLLHKGVRSWEMGDASHHSETFGGVSSRNTYFGVIFLHAYQTCHVSAF